MNVDFIRIEHWLASGRARCERTKRAQHALPSSARPRAKHDRTRHPKSRADVTERSAHRANRDVAKSSSSHFAAEQLSRPCRARPTEFLRRAMKDFNQLATKSIINFARTVEVPTIVEAVDAAIAKCCAALTTVERATAISLATRTLECPRPRRAIARNRSAVCGSRQRRPSMIKKRRRTRFISGLFPARPLSFGCLAISKRRAGLAYFHLHRRVIDIHAR